jgi:hypothetical protein
MKERMEQPPQRQPFNELSFEEQDARFGRLKSILTNSSQYREFWRKAYTHPTQFNIEGTPAEKASQTLDMVSGGVRFLRDVLEFFRQIKLRENGQGDSSSLELTNEEVANHSYARHFLKDKKIDVRRTDDMFEWSLQVFVKKAEALGNKSDVTLDEIQGLKEDMEYILEKVNDYLH